MICYASWCAVSNSQAGLNHDFYSVGFFFFFLRLFVSLAASLLTLPRSF